jgi:hypothetical protein
MMMRARATKMTRVLAASNGGSDISLSVPITWPLLRDGVPRVACLRPWVEVERENCLKSLRSFHFEL